MATAFITGGHGNLGRQVSAAFRARGDEVVTFDLPGTPSASPNAHVGDVRDTAALEELLQKYRPDVVVHLASLLSGSSEVDRIAAWEINATASVHLLDAVVRLGVPRFFFASTAATYDGVGAEPIDDDRPQWPYSLYGATKVAVERVGHYFAERHGLDFRCLRFPFVISPDAPPGAVSAFPAQAFRAAAAATPFVFPISPDIGASTLYVDDVVRSIVEFVTVDRRHVAQPVYNLHAFRLTAAMVGEAAAQRFGDFDYRFEADTDAERLLSGWPEIVDDSAARRDWGWAPQFGLDETLERLAASVRGQ